MYYEELDLPCVPKSWNLADDLGQVEYVFSDKTGTLTRNVMEFRRCSINGNAYGATMAKSPNPARPTTQYLVPDTYQPKSKYASISPTFYDACLVNDMNANDDHSRVIAEFWRLIGVCHTVLVSSPDSDDPYDIQYKAQSPDEAALVETGKDVGFTFLRRELTDVFIDVFGIEEKYTLLAVLEFNSTRKRMSVIVRRPDGAIVLYCKGADTVIYERLSSGNNEIIKDVTLKHLEIFADEGLRTLCLAYREVGLEEFQDWMLKYNDACTSIVDREQLLDEVAELIERDLILLGATAIEDRLQDGVPETIQTLRDAGIKVWVLTGDKMETAISIGFSCNLLSRDLNLIVIKGDSVSIPEQIQNAINTFFSPVRSNPPALSSGKAENAAKQASHIHLNHFSDHALIIDGAALKIALEDSNREALLNLGCKCKVVVCCRVSPLQKAQVVSLVKDGRSAVTCAIGDGANDVSMIQAAHIGVGIAGEEGLQAVMASDYAIAQFRYLSRLLLVHGRWSYHRVSELIFNYFYKDIIFVFVIFWYQFFAGFSAQEPYEFTYMLFYNLFFTNWPVMVLGIFDQDVPDYLAAKVPQLYQSGIKQSLFTTWRFSWYMLEGLYQSAVCFLIPYLIYSPQQASHSNGGVADRLEMGTTMAAAAITSANLFVALNTKTFTWITQIAIFPASIGVFYTYVAVYTNVESSPVMGLGSIIWTSSSFWLGMVLSVVVSLLPRYVTIFWLRNYCPTDCDIAIEYQKYDLDLDPLLPKVLEVPDLPPPPSAHPEKLSVTIPFVQSVSKSGSDILEIMTTPAILNTSVSHFGFIKSPVSPKAKSSNSGDTIPSPLPQQASSGTLDSSKSPTASMGGSKPSSHITLMKNMSSKRNRGFSFSTDESGGMRNIIMCELAVPAAASSSKGRRKSTASDWELYRTKGNKQGISIPLQSIKSTVNSMQRQPSSFHDQEAGTNPPIIVEPTTSPVRVSFPEEIKVPNPTSQFKKKVGHSRSQSTGDIPREPPNQILGELGLEVDPTTGRVLDKEVEPKKNANHLEVPRTSNSNPIPEKELKPSGSNVPPPFSKKGHRRAPSRPQSALRNEVKDEDASSKPSSIADSVPRSHKKADSISTKPVLASHLSTSPTQPPEHTLPDDPKP
jgi:phospholipid-translocating ATPase